MREKHLKFNFSLNLENTKTVEETVEALKLYYAFVSGDIKLNGSELNEYAIKETEKNLCFGDDKVLGKSFGVTKEIEGYFYP